MKAITTTQILKDLNPGKFTGAVGSIKLISSLPVSFFSPTYNLGQRTDGYHTLNPVIHQADGFFDVVTPAVDPALEKLGAIYFDVNQFTYPVIELTQAEKDAYTQQLEDADASAQKLQQYKADGQIGFDRAYAMIQRKFDNGLITGTQAQNIATSLYLVIEPLYKGLWQLAKVNIDAQTPPVNSELLDIFNKVKTAITNYVNDNY